MRTLMHTHDHQHDVCLNLSIVRALFPWYQLLLVESNWIGCNWLWSAGWNSKCWLCINIQIKSLFILCVYVCTDVCCCIDCKRRPWADITCVAKKIKKMTERKSGDFYGEKEEWRLGNKEVGDRVMRSVVKGRKGDAAPTLKAREDENWEKCTDAGWGFHLIWCVCLHVSHAAFAALPQLWQKTDFCYFWSMLDRVGHH